MIGGLNEKFYSNFWKFQNYFKNLNEIFLNFKEFEEILNSILNLISNIKYENILNQNFKEFFVSKFLTQRNLLNFEVKDSKFICQILIQILILFKNFEENQQKNLNSKLKIIDNFKFKIYDLIKKISSKDFLISIKIILNRELNWIEWKKEKCLENLEFDYFEEEEQQQEEQKEQKSIEFGTIELNSIFNSNQEIQIENFMNSKESDNFLNHLSTEKLFEKLKEQLDPDSGFEKEESINSNKIYSFKIQRKIFH